MSSLRNDADLLALAPQWEEAVLVLAEVEEQVEEAQCQRMRARERCAHIRRQIALAPAVTLEGLHLKARCVRDSYGADPDTMRGDLSSLIRHEGCDGPSAPTAALLLALDVLAATRRRAALAAECAEAERQLAEDVSKRQTDVIHAVDD